jgi:hypothetical protein
VRDPIAMAYAVPERFQEMVSRGLELGDRASWPACTRRWT